MQTKIYHQLIEQFAQFEIIDAHEHLREEQDRLDHPADVFILFRHYTKGDLIGAGMTEQQFVSLHNPEIPLDQRWKTFEPFFQAIRHGSYARPAFIGAKEFYGVDDINADTYHELSEKIAEANTPGIYDRWIRDKCNIRRSILCRPLPIPVEHPLFVSLTPMARFALKFYDRSDVDAAAEDIDVSVANLDDYINLIHAALKMGADRGDVGVKMGAKPYGEPDRKKAEPIFNKIMIGDSLSVAELQPLWDYTVDEMLKEARKYHKVIAVHTGVWDDFRQLNATHMIPIVKRYPDLKFDLFHASIPYVRECGLMAKNFPNVYLNLCWSHIVSPMMTRSCLNEWIDIAPANKITAFGADYFVTVEKIFGHLVMARENIAHVLSARVNEGLMSKDQAVNLAQSWFHDVPANLYGV